MKKKKKTGLLYMNESVQGCQKCLAGENVRPLKKEVVMKNNKERDDVRLTRNGKTKAT